MISNILDNKEEIVNRIVNEKGISREEVEKRISEKVKEYGGLLTEAGAAFALAKELGIEIGSNQSSDEWTDISKVNEDMGFVNIVGVVKAVSPVRAWGNENRTGKVARILLSDSTGEIWVVLWNQDAELVEKNQIKQGTIVGIKNGVVKKRDNGSVEVNTSMRSRIIPDIKTEKELPEIKSEKIENITPNMKSVNLYARVERVFPKTEFNSNGRAGKVTSMIINDGNRIRVVAWGELADKVENLSPNQLIKLENAIPKDNNGNLELHLNWLSKLVENPENAPEIPKLEINTDTNTFTRKKIKDVKEGPAEVRGVVVKVYPPNRIKVCPVCGAIVEDICPEHGKSKDTLILNLEIDDGTGVLRGVLFRDAAERFLSINEVNDESINEGIDRVLGEEFIFGGQIKNNNLFDRLEIHIKYFKKPNIDDEIKMEERGE